MKKRFTILERIGIWLGFLSPCCGKPMDDYGYKVPYCADEFGGCGKRV